MKIEILIKNKSDMRYDTWDDYYYREDGTLVFEIADTGVKSFNQLLLIHAMIEQLLAQNKGVTIEEINKYDLAYQKTYEGLAGEPGEQIDCPYTDAHVAAKGIEMMLCGMMGLPWKAYEEALCDE